MNVLIVPTISTFTVKLLSCLAIIESRSANHKVCDHISILFTQQLSDLTEKLLSCCMGCYASVDLKWKTVENSVMSHCSCVHVTDICLINEGQSFLD